MKLLNGEEGYIEAKPIRRIYARKGWPLSFIGLPCIVIAGFLSYSWATLSPASPGGGVMRLMLLLTAVPFFLLGLFLTAGLYILFYLEAPAVLYTVTSRRVVIRRGFVIHKEFEIFVGSIAGLQVIHHGGREKAGTIRFIASGGAPGAPFYMKRFPTERFRGDVHYAIEAVPDVDSVRFYLERAIDQKKQLDLSPY